MMIVGYEGTNSNYCIIWQSENFQISKLQVLLKSGKIIGLKKPMISSIPFLPCPVMLSADQYLRLTPLKTV
jgi:hypothetical protein